MRKHLPLMISALAFTFCACDNEGIVSDCVSVSQKLTITASFGDSDGEGSRTSLQENGSVWWNPGDALSLFYGSGASGGSKFTADIVSPASVANFTGVIDVITGGGEISVEDTWFWATYPYNSGALCDGSSITTVLPSEQTGCKGSFADNTFITVARSTGLLMSFYNVCSGLKFTVTNPDVEQVRFKSNGGEMIAGTARIKFDGSGIPYVDAITDGTDEIVVTAPDGGCFEVGEPYYVVLLPQTLSSGFTVTFDTWYEAAVREITKSATFKRAVFNTMIDADKNVEYVEKPSEQIFEDPDFEAYCIENFDQDQDGKISRTEAEAVTEINVKNQIQDGSITSLKGIGMFRNLERLYCYGLDAPKGQLTSLDLSRNTALTILRCDCNELVSLDVSKNTALNWLWCYSNQLTSLDVSKNTALTELCCYYNELTSLDVSNNTALTDLYCFANQLTSLDVSNNTALTDLACGYNPLMSLDVSKNTALTSLHCYNNLLTSLDVSKNTALTELSCHSNQLMSLDVSKNTALTRLECSYNPLTSLDVSKNTALTRLECTGNKLTSLDVNKNTALTYLNCHYNLLTGLDVSNNAALTYLSCYSNQLTSLDVSKNIALTNLQCSFNPLSYLYIYQGQSIPNITENRSEDYIPAETTILVASEGGGNEGTGEGESY